MGDEPPNPYSMCDLNKGALKASCFAVFLFEYFARKRLILSANAFSGFFCVFKRRRRGVRLLI